MSKTKLFFATMVGAMAGIALIALGEWIMEHFYSLGAGVDMQDKKALATAIAAMPLGAFLSILLIHGLAALTGGLIAVLVLKEAKAKPSILVGILLTLFGLINIIMIQHPLWFSIINLIEYVPFAYLGFKIALQIVKNKK